MSIVEASLDSDCVSSSSSSSSGSCEGIHPERSPHTLGSGLQRDQVPLGMPRWSALAYTKTKGLGYPAILTKQLPYQPTRKPPKHTCTQTPTQTYLYPPKGIKQRDGTTGIAHWTPVPFSAHKHQPQAPPKLTRGRTAIPHHTCMGTPTHLRWLRRVQWRELWLRTDSSVLPTYMSIGRCGPPWSPVGMCGVEWRETMQGTGEKLLLETVTSGVPQTSSNKLPPCSTNHFFGGWQRVDGLPGRTAS